MKPFLSTLIILLTLLQSQAQERTIRGVVMDEKGIVLPGVSIVIKGTTRGTNTDAEGKFSISVNQGAKLQLSFVGYASQEVDLANRSTISVRLQPDVSQLGEVIVVGYGTQRKREVAGAQVGVKGEQIQNMPIPSFDRMLQGRAAGVQINSNNGIPGGATQVRIRGVGSISAGNNPLYIIDGVQIAPGDRSRGITSSNPLNGVNPNDIESIEVLKDAAASSIYGAQAANGVIIITTKKGKAGKPQFEVNAYIGQTQNLNDFELLNGPEWVRLRREAAFNAGGEAAALVADQNYGTTETAPSYDWQQLVLRKGAIQNIEFSARGGTEATTYFIGASFNNTIGHFIGTDFKRGSFRINMDNKLSDKFSLETRTNFSVVGQNSSFVPALNTNNIPVLAIGRLPIDNPYNEDGSYNTNLRGALGPIAHPRAIIEYNTNLGTTMQGIGNFALNYDILPGLRFRSSYGLEFTEIAEESFSDPRTPAGSAGSVTDFLNTRVVNWQTDQTLNLNKTFKQKHNLQALAGFNYRSEALNSITLRGNNAATPAFKRTLAGTTAVTMTTAYTAWRLASVFGRLQYNYDEKYIASLTLRRDGVSRFGRNKRFGYFPAAALAWRLSEEPFLKSIAAIDELKLRVSYGATGNSDGIDNFASLALFASPAAAAYSGQPGTNFATVLVAAGVNSPKLGNPDLSWESNIMTNFGIDYGLIKNRITGSIDYFIRDTKNLLFNVPVPSTSGFDIIIKNVGAVRNTGLELALSSRNMVGAFQWTTDFNISFNKNEVTKLLEEGKDLPNNALFLGYPLGTPFLARWAGVNPADGRAMWYDTLGNVTYNPVARDRVLMNRSVLIPRYFGGLTNTFSYKGFELSAFLQYQVGNLVNNAGLSNQALDYRFDTNQFREVLNRWTAPGQVTDIPRLIPGATEAGSASSLFGGNIAGSDRFYEDGSYIRLKQLTFSYTIPSLLLSKAKLRTTRIYAQGVNLWTATHFKGFDPEFAAVTNFNTGAFGNNVGVIPPGKMYIVGLQIGF